LLGATGVKGIFDLPDNMLDKIDDVLVKMTGIERIAKVMEVDYAPPKIEPSSTMVILFENEIREDDFEPWLKFWDALIGGIKIKGHCSAYVHEGKWYGYAASIKDSIGQLLALKYMEIFTDDK
jgi:hypothetical protein